MQGGGTWMDVTNVTVNGNNGQATFSQSGVDTGVDQWNGDPLQSFWQNYYNKINAGKAALNAKPTPEQYIQAIANAAQIRQRLFLVIFTTRVPRVIERPLPPNAATA